MFRPIILFFFLSLPRSWPYPQTHFHAIHNFISLSLSLSFLSLCHCLSFWLSASFRVYIYIYIYIYIYCYYTTISFVIAYNSFFNISPIDQLKYSVNYARKLNLTCRIKLTIYLFRSVCTHILKHMGIWKRVFLRTTEINRILIRFLDMDAHSHQHTHTHTHTHAYIYIYIYICVCVCVCVCVCMCLCIPYQRKKTLKITNFFLVIILISADPMFF